MAILGETGYALIQPSTRAIGTILADVTVEESHRDEMIITQHPVEGGAIISDHAFKRPALVEIRCGFSNSSAGRVGYVQEQYQKLLALQLARQPFNVYTGKRQYRNMLVVGISVITDPHSENILMVSASLQEIIIVSTATTGTGTDTTKAGDSGNQSNPASTGDVRGSGDVEGQSIGSQAFNGSYNPGDYSQGGGTFNPISPGTGDLGLGGAVGSALDGLSPPTMLGDVGGLTATGPGGVPLPDASVPASPGYNPFATGAFGGT